MKKLRLMLRLTMLLLGLTSFTLMPYCLNGQQEDKIRYSYDFTEKLKEVSLDFIEPVEGFYKVRNLEKDDFLDYDLVLDSREKNFEMRFIIKHDKSSLIPNIECLSTASTLAINDEHFDLTMRFFEPQELEERFNADWGAYVDFIPKRSITDKHFGRLMTLFAENKGLVHAIFFFNQHDEEKDIRMMSFSFIQ